MEAVWSLIAQGLAYLDFTQPSASNWVLLPTAKGLSPTNSSTRNEQEMEPYGEMTNYSERLPIRAHDGGRHGAASEPHDAVQS